MATERIANAAAAMSLGGFSITLANVDTIISITAGCVAIVAGLAAAWYHIAKTRRLKNGTNDS